MTTTKVEFNPSYHFLVDETEWEIIYSPESLKHIQHIQLLLVLLVR